MGLPLFRHAGLCQWVLWCLIYALPLQGLSGVVAQWLGAQHFHREVAVSAFADHHHHGHAAVQRHRHTVTDATVIAIGVDAGNGEADLTSLPGAWGSLAGTCASARLHLQAGLSHERPASTAWSVLSCEAQQVDKPPDA
jgi:hypothetical protein